ncbi:hypothetical protein BLOT_002872 [Blomia tropicalis]|nr:hypothetical protein BLOT_002872 [Blomia tropicalis]
MFTSSSNFLFAIVDILGFKIFDKPICKRKDLLLFTNRHKLLDRGYNCKGKWLVTIYPKSIRILHSTHKLTCILGNQFIRPALILDMIKLFATVAIVMCNEIVALTYIRYTGWIDDYINIQCVIDKYTSDVRFTVHHFCRRTLV